MQYSNAISHNTKVTPTQIVKPLLKWMGGKRFLLPEIFARLPNTIRSFCEPYVGGGSVWLSVKPHHAIINDGNQTLMCLYDVVKNDPEALIASVLQHENTEAYYYKIRQLDRDVKAYQRMSAIEKASRLLFLNKTCFNGMFRVNKSGEFNVPYGRYAKTRVIDPDNIRALSHYFNHSDIHFYAEDAVTLIQSLTLTTKTFFYFDPPYSPVSETANFVGYTASGFSFQEQVRLYELCVQLHQQGHQFLLSNSNNADVVDMYQGHQDFIVETVQARRRINCKGDKRGAIDEVLVRNYATGEDYQ